MRRWGMLLAIAAIAVMAVAQEKQLSLADQAAAARNQKQMEVGSEEMGRVVNGDYQNPYFGLNIRRLPDWQSMGRGEMNVTEASGREVLGAKAGVHSQRVFGMSDLRGASLFVGIVAVPPGLNPADITPIQQKKIAENLPDPKFSDEPVMLNDAQHAFTGFRTTYTLREKAIYQSQQCIVRDGHLIMFTLTANSPEDLTGLWRQLKTNITWTK